jgi:hypothetical protein
MLAIRYVVIALSAAIAIALLVNGNVVIGLLLLALVVARVVSTVMMRRRIKTYRERRFARMQPPPD